MNIKCASFFAGVGGIDKGFELAGFETIYANEIDKYASKTFNANFSSVKLDTCDIKDLDENVDIPDFNILLGGFPCQAFSVAGYRQGFNDKKGRGNLFFDLIRIIKAKQPEVVFLENVKNLIGHDNGNTFDIINRSLELEGYYVKAMVLNTSQYGNLPQTRERIYLVCFKDKKQYHKFCFPKPIKLDKTLKDLIDFDSKQDEKFYYREGKCKFYDKLKEGVVNSNTC